MKIFLVLSILMMLTACSSASKQNSPTDRDAIDSTIKSQKTSLVRCYDHFTQINPGFEGGKVLLQWLINSMGRAENVLF